MNKIAIIFSFTFFKIVPTIEGNSLYILTNKEEDDIR